MSGGQQQRVALARALAIEPQVLLLDEPLSALDAKIRIVLRKEIRAIQRQLGITTVYVTHDQEEALSLSDRVVVMSDGRIEQIGTPSEIYNFPSTAFVASFVGTLNLVNAGVIDAGGGPAVDRRPGGPDEQGRDRRRGGWAGHAGRPARGHLAAARAGRSRTTSAAIVEDINFLGSIVRIRIRLGEGVDGATPTVVALDTFNEPHLKVPEVGEPGHRVVPAGGVLRPRRGARRRAGDRGGRRGGVTVRLDGIDLVVFDKDGTIIEFGAMWSGWAVALAERRCAARSAGPSTSRCSRCSATTPRPGPCCPAAGWRRRRWLACASGRGTCWSSRA